jgi:hypothetical protein
MSIENPINDAQFADALLNESLKNCKKPEENKVNEPNYRVDLDAVAREREYFD